MEGKLYPATASPSLLPGFVLHSRPRKSFCVGLPLRVNKPNNSRIFLASQPPPCPSLPPPPPGGRGGVSLPPAQDPDRFVTKISFQKILLRALSTLHKATYSRTDTAPPAGPEQVRGQDRV